MERPQTKLEYTECQQLGNSVHVRPVQSPKSSKTMSVQVLSCPSVLFLIFLCPAQKRQCRKGWEAGGVCPLPHLVCFLSPHSMQAGKQEKCKGRPNTRPGTPACHKICLPTHPPSASSQAPCCLSLPTKPVPVPGPGKMSTPILLPPKVRKKSRPAKMSPKKAEGEGGGRVGEGKGRSDGGGWGLGGLQVWESVVHGNGRWKQTKTQ